MFVQRSETSHRVHSVPRTNLCVHGSPQHPGPGEAVPVRRQPSTGRYVLRALPILPVLRQSILRDEPLQGQYRCEFVLSKSCWAPNFPVDLAGRIAGLPKKDALTCLTAVYRTVAPSQT
eukprot:scaffold1074_cov409-Prasinococcus_capsulatus_cf.AAC.6